MGMETFKVKVKIFLRVSEVIYRISDKVIFRSSTHLKLQKKKNIG